MQENLWTYEQVAKFFGVGRRTIERWAERSDLTRLRFSPKIVRFDPADVAALANKKKGE